MIRAATISMLILGLLSGVGHAQGDSSDRNVAVQQAIKAADAWVKLIDDAKYAESWQQAAAFFKEHLTADQWAKMAAAARKPVGRMVSRKFKMAQYATHLLGAPEGQYVVIMYDTEFANRKNAVETVTPMLDKDGQWRVSGYYIR